MPPNVESLVSTKVTKATKVIDALRHAQQHLWIRPNALEFSTLTAQLYLSSIQAIFTEVQHTHSSLFPDIGIQPLNISTMTDPLSIASSLVGLVTISALIASTARDLYAGGGKGAPASMCQIQEEMEQLNTIFCQMQRFILGAEKPRHAAQSLVSVHHLMTILSGSVLICSRLEGKLNKVAGLDHYGTQGPAKRTGIAVDRINWNFWQADEADEIIMELQRTKMNWNLMLTIFQCNAALESPGVIPDTLTQTVAQIFDSNSSSATQLREIMKRHEGLLVGAQGASEALTSSITSAGAILGDTASIFTTASLATITTITPTFYDDLINSRAYKRQRRLHLDSDSDSIFSISSDSKGDSWSVLSELSLGDLSISEISVFELPISLSDLYDPSPYMLHPNPTATGSNPTATGSNPTATGSNPTATGSKVRSWARATVGPLEVRLHHAVATNNGFAIRTILSLGADIDSKFEEKTPLILAASLGHESACKLLLKRGASVEAVDSAGHTPLMLAAREGHEPVFRLCFEKGAYVDAVDFAGQTPLMLAARGGYESVSRLCLDRGASVNAVDSTGQTPLMLAAYGGHESVSRLCLDRGASVNAVDSTGQTPLMLAAGGTVCMLLLDRGALIDAVNSAGHTPLMIAAEKGMEDVCRVLLDRGALVDAVDPGGRTALMNAAERGKVNVCRLLLERGGSTDIVDTTGHTLLMIAMQGGQEIVCRLLLNGGVSANVVDSAGHTPLIKAAEEGWEVLCGVLLDASALIDGVDSVGRTPLMAAAERGQETVCSLLLDRGASMSTTDSIGHTPLMFAANRGHQSVCQLLLDRGAVVDAVESSGRTSLMIAAERGHHSVCQLLLEAKASINAVDLEGRTPLMAAAVEGQESICRLLLDSGANINAVEHKTNMTALALASRQGHEHVCKLLLEMGGKSTEAGDATGQTLLMIAASSGHHSVCQLLLEMEASINAVDFRGRTPLMAAAVEGQESICRLLLDSGANINAVEHKTNMTALALASHQGHEHVCRLLLDRGASVDASDSTGLTPLAHAASQYHESVCSFLVTRGANTTALQYIKTNHNIDETIDSALAKGCNVIFNLLLSIIIGSDPARILRKAWLSQRLHTAIDTDEKNTTLLATLVDCMGYMHEAEMLDSEGRTPLVHAAFLCRETACQLLYDKGARVGTQTKVSVQTRIHEAIDKDSKLVVQLLLDMGANIEQRGSYQMTPLLYALYRKNGEIAKLLIDAGADPLARDNGEWSVIHCAVHLSSGSSDVLSHLLDTKAGRLIDSIDADGDTPLHHCAQDKDYWRWAEILVQHGAKVTVSNGYGRTAYQEAVKVKNTPVARYLWSRLSPEQKRLQGPRPEESDC